MWNQEWKVSEKKGLRGGVVAHQDGLLSVVSLYNDLPDSYFGCLQTMTMEFC